MPLALACICFMVASLRLVLVSWVSFLGDSVCLFLGIVVYMFLWSYTGLLIHLCVCCIASSSGSAYRFLLVRVFSGLPPCEG